MIATAACSTKGSSVASTATPICPPRPNVPVMFRIAEQRDVERMNAHVPLAPAPTSTLNPGHRPFVTVGEALLSAFRQMPQSHPLNRAARDMERRE